MKYHLTPEGPKPCRASVKACKYGAEHYGGLEQARKAQEEQLEAEFSLTGLKTPTAGEASADVSRAYAHWSILNDHLHNAGNMGNDAELLYYSSPQGQLELTRRRRGHYVEGYNRIAEQVQALKPGTFSYGISEEEIQAQIKLSEPLLNRDSSFLNKASLAQERGARKAMAPLGHYLVEQSHRWMQKLTPEEQESVSWLTSNGFGLMQYAVGRENENSGSYFIGLVDENAIHDLHHPDYDLAEKEILKARRKVANKYRKTVLSALAKAPKLEEPLIISRGTSLKEFSEILGEPENQDYKSLMDAVESGAANGKEPPKNSRISQIPESATMLGSRAMSFSQRLWDQKVNEDREVVLAVKTQTLASPVNVGAWSTAEYEVFTNPFSRYRITGGRREGDDLFILELEEF